jgi:hypothetical protein
MATSFNINGEVFKTKKALRERIISIRDSYPDDERLNKEDFDFMREVLEHHESAPIKIGCGVSEIYPRTNPIYKKNRCFYLKRTDGTETDFSFLMCLTSEKNSDKVKNAFRKAVAPYIIEFKNCIFKLCGEPIPCQITKEYMYSNSNCHVDHAKPNTFLKIVEDFCKEENLDIEKIKVISSNDGMIGNEIEDKSIKEKFISFHNKRAKLRLVSTTANLSVLK